MALVEPVAEAAERSQVIVLTHALAFAEAVGTRASAARIELRRATTGTQATTTSEP